MIKKGLVLIILLAGLTIPAASQPGPAPGGELIESLRSDFLIVSLGIILTTFGFVAVVISLFPLKPRVYTAMTFGGLYLLYGFRLLARTDLTPLLLDLPPPLCGDLSAFAALAVPVPLLIFMEQLLGKGWRSSLRAAWIVHLIVLAAAAAFGAAGERTGMTALLIEGLLLVEGGVILLNVFRARRCLKPRQFQVLAPGASVWALLMAADRISALGWLPWASGLEMIAFLELACCLGYVLIYTYYSKEKQLSAIEHELATAHSIQHAILPAAMPDLRGLTVAARYIPMKEVGGDFYEFLVPDKHRLGVLIADVSGHGVPAALIASMVKVAVTAQIDAASRPGDVLAGINRILCGKFENEFVTAGYAYLDMKKREVLYSGAGHPPLLVWRSSRRRLIQLKENGLFLGQFPDEKYHAVDLPIEIGDRLILYTDGIVEARNPADEEFGEQRFFRLIRENSHAPPDGFIDGVLEELDEWRGGNGAAPADDITMVVIDVTT